MKFQLELNCVEDGRTFLNYWDAAHGNDVVCEVVDGRLLLTQDEGKPKKITLSEFIEMVEASNAMRTV
jgi:hypothetical protein